jgi:hypothetical protein
MDEESEEWEEWEEMSDEELEECSCEDCMLELQARRN